MDNQKIQVFISSSMQTEYTLNWKHIREELTGKLKDNSLFEPFNLYDHSSSESVESYYLDQLSQSDLVVFLIGPVVRKGTYAEFEKVIQLNKRHMFFFDEGFCECDMPDDDSGVKMSSKKFMRNTPPENLGTYRKLDLAHFNCEEVMIDILNEVHRTFSKYPNINTHVNKGSSFNLDNLDSPSIFTSSPNMLKNVIFREKSELSTTATFSFKVFDWLVNGNDLPDVDEYKSTISKKNELNSLVPLLTERWKAITSYMHGECGESLEHEKEALRLATKGKAAGWLKKDILIDCCNISYKNNPNTLIETNEFQTKLDSDKEEIFYPILDRYKSGLLEIFMNEMEKYGLQEPGTINFGSLLPIILNKLQDYLLTATLFGSLTYINQAREFLSKILMNYGNVFKDPDTILLAIKLYFLNGESDVAIKTIRKYFPLIGSKFLIDLHDIFKVFKSKNCIEKEKGELAFISICGYELNEEEIIIAKTDLISNIDEWISPYDLKYMEQAFKKLSPMLTPDEVLMIAKKILNNRKMVVIHPNVSQALVEHEISEYDVTRLSNVLNKLKLVIRKTDHFDFSFLLPFIGNNSQIPDEIIEGLKDCILKKSNPCLISFYKLENNNDPFNMTDFFLSLSVPLKDWVKCVSRKGTIRADSLQLDLIDYELLNREQTQENIDKLAEIICDPIKIALTSSNAFTIMHILNTLISMFESIYINKLEFPKKILWLEHEEMPNINISSTESSKDEEIIYDMFLSIKSIISNNDDDWLRILSRQNKSSIRNYGLKIFRDMSITNSVSQKYINLISNWLKSKQESIVLSSIPVAIYIILFYHSKKLTQNISSLSGSSYLNIKIKILSLLLRFSDCKDTQEFKFIYNAFRDDNNWRIVNMVKAIENSSQLGHKQ